MKVLVTGAGGDIGQSVIRCIRETRPRYTIVGCDIDPFAAGRSMVKRFYRAPRATEGAAYDRFLLRFVENEGIDYIFPTSEPEILRCGGLRERLGAGGATVFINDEFCVGTFFDKYSTVEFLREHGFAHPRTWLLKDFRGQTDYPVILKKRRGWGGKGVRIIRRPEELVPLRAARDDSIVQEIVGSPDEEYTSAVFSDGKDAFSICFRRELGYGSLTKVARLVADKKAARLACRIARVLDLRGSLNIQFRKSGGDFVPLEINPRFSSTVYIRHCFGFSDVGWWMDLQENRTITFKPRYRAGVAVRCLSEVFFGLKR